MESGKKREVLEGYRLWRHGHGSHGTESFNDLVKGRRYPVVEALCLAEAGVDGSQEVRWLRAAD